MSENTIGQKSSNIKILGLVLGILIIFIAHISPCPEGLSQEGKMAISLLVAGLVVWMMEVVPPCISALFLMILMAYFNILGFSDIWSKFASSAWFFILATFAITAALRKTTIPLRITAALLKWSKGNSKKVVFCFLFAPFLLSCFTTNLAATAMFMGLAVGLLQANNCIPGKSNLGRALMMAVPYGAFIGGCTLLCGSSANLTVLALSESNFNFTIGFAEWASVGIPLAIILIPVTLFTLCFFYKPESVTMESINKIVADVKALGKWNAMDKKVAAVILLCLALWISSTWVKEFQVAAVGILGMLLFFLPGMNVLTYKEFADGVNWNVLLLVGSVVALAAGLSATGAGSWMASVLMPLFDGASSTGVMGISSVSSIFIRMLLPSGSAMAGVSVLPFGEIALATGTSMAAMIIMIAWMSGTTFVLPVDALMLIPYSYGYTSLLDPLKVGFVPAFTIAIYASTIAPWLFRIFWGM